MGTHFSLNTLLSSKMEMAIRLESSTWTRKAQGLLPQRLLVPTLATLERSSPAMSRVRCPFFGLTTMFSAKAILMQIACQFSSARSWAKLKAQLISSDLFETRDTVFKISTD